MNGLRSIWAVLVLAALTACAPAQPTIAEPVPAAVCAPQAANTANPAACTPLDVQSARIEAAPGTQATYRTDGFSLVLDGRILLRYEADTVRLLVEEGRAVLSAHNGLRTLAAGDEAFVQQRTLVLDDVPTQTPVLLTPEETAGCPVPPDWQGTYTVRRGDTLAGIAQRHDALVAAVVAANCLEDPGSLQPGDVLVMPQSLQASATATAPYIVFVADNYVVDAGECTTLRWDVSGAESATLNGEEIAVMGSQPLCPDSASEYTLNMRFPGAVEIERTISISVRD